MHDLLPSIELQKERSLVFFGRAARLQHYETRSEHILTNVVRSERAITSLVDYEMGELYWSRIDRMGGEKLGPFCLQSLQNIEVRVLEFGRQPVDFYKKI